MNYIFKNISEGQCVDGRNLSDTDDRVLALMLLYPEKWRELLPEIYNYYDRIFYRMVTSILALESKARYSKFCGVINTGKVRCEWDYLLEQILIFNGDFRIHDIILSQNIMYHSTTYEFLANREVMISFSELFPENWQDYWLEYHRKRIKMKRKR